MSDIEKHLRGMRAAADREERERRQRERREEREDRERERKRTAGVAVRDRYHLVGVPPIVRPAEVPGRHAAVVRDFAERLPAGAWQTAGWLAEDRDGATRLVRHDGFVRMADDVARPAKLKWGGPTPKWHGPGGLQPVPRRRHWDDWWNGVAGHHAGRRALRGGPG